MGNFWSVPAVLVFRSFILRVTVFVVRGRPPADFWRYTGNIY